MNKYLIFILITSAICTVIIYFISSDTSELGIKNDIDKIVYYREKNRVTNDTTEQIEQSVNYQSSINSAAVQSESLSKQDTSQEITTLWNVSPRVQHSDEEEVPTEYIQTDSADISALGMASRVEAYIPQTGKTYYGQVVKEDLLIAGVSYLDVELEGIENIYRMSINRGQQATYIWIATPEGVFNIEINSESGKGTIVSSDDTEARWPLKDDAVIDKDANREIEPPQIIWN
jgi:hypothetical protein